MTQSYYLLQKGLTFERATAASISIEALKILKLVIGHLMKFKFSYLSIALLLFISIVTCKESPTQATEGTSQTKPHVLTSVLTAPELITPKINSETATTVHLQWKKVENAENYQLYLSENQDFETILADSVVDSTSVLIKNLPQDTTLYWKVGSNVEGTETQWSDKWNFKTRAKADPASTGTLAAPAPAAPSDKGTGVALNPKFKWKAVDGADGYIVDASHGDQSVIHKQVDGTDFTPKKSLTGEETYYWRVRAIAGDTKGKWSDKWNFKTSAKADPASTGTLAAPAQVAPSDKGTDVALNPKFKWKAVDGADGYIVDASHGDQSVIHKQVDGTDFTPKKTLSGEKSYYWRVRAIAGDTKGKWSDKWNFKTSAKADPAPTGTLKVPALVAPSANAKDVARVPTFKWKAVDGADEYQLDYQLGGDHPVIHQKLKKTKFTPDKALAIQKTYYWHVRALRDGNPGKWAETKHFTTGSSTSDAPSVDLVSPDDGASDQPVALSLHWKPLSGFSQYHIQVATGNGFAHLVTDKTTGSTKYKLSGLDKNQTYYWRVQATAGGSSSNWSAARSFHTQAARNNGGSSVRSDRQALMDLYKATGGNHWAHNRGWGSDRPLASWYGIKTNNTGQVTRIDLWHNNLKGNLPASIGNLTEATYLNVKYNHLTGSIPPEIGDMTNLEALILQGRTYIQGRQKKVHWKQPPDNLNNAYNEGKHLSNTNDFSGKIPRAIGKLSNLRLLEIANAPNIKGPIPSELGDLSNLEGLFLRFDDFSGTRIPSSLGRLHKLKQLDIAAAQLVGEIPGSLENLTELRYLNLGEESNHTPDNHLTGKIPDFSRLTNLRTILLTDNELTGKYPHYWNNGNFKHLVTLRLSWNKLTGTLHGFNNLPALQSFGVEGNELTGTIKKQLTQLPKRLQILGLGWNNFTGKLPKSGWPNFTQLKTLYLNNNKLSGKIPCDFWDKIDNPRLGICWVGHNNFNGNCTRSMNKVTGNTTGGTSNLNIDISGNNF